MLENILTDDLVILSTRENKEALLRGISSLPRLYRVLVTSIEELEEALFGKGDISSISYLMEEKGFSYEVANMYLDHFKYLSLPSVNKVELTSLLEELKSVSLWKKEESLLRKIKGKKILAVDLPFSKWNQFILSHLENEVIFLEEEKPMMDYDLFEGETFEETIAFLAEQICSLSKRGVSFSDMVITNVKEEDFHLLHRIFSYYHLPFQKKTISFGKTDYAKQFLRKLEEQEAKEVLDTLDPKDDYYQVLVDCLNELSSFTGSKKTYLELLKQMFHKKQVVLERNLDGIRIESFTARKQSSDYVFVLNVGENSFPSYQKDEDFFSDQERESMGLDTSREENEKRREQSKRILHHTPHLVLLTCLSKQGEEVYFPSLLAKEEKEKKPIFLTYCYSNLYNQLELGKKLDLLRKYQSKDTTLNLLWQKYSKLPYQTYDNKYSKVPSSKVRSLLKDRLVLSYSSMSHYYQCSFRFYLERVLKLNSFEETFAAYLGSLYHNLLSLAFFDDFDLEKEFLSYQKRRELTPKEHFLLKKLYEDLKELIEVIKEQNTFTNFQKALYEQEIEMTFQGPFSICFKGLIDKILWLEKDDCTYFAVIDYKTGMIPNNMENMVYGLDMQLGVYLYLIMNSKLLSHPKPVGFYFQKIMQKGSKNMDYRLQGYSTDEISLLEEFDTTYQNSKLIKSMKYTEKGFGAYTKLCSNDQVSSMLTLVEQKINEAIQAMIEGKFDINPKVIGKENVSCTYCPFQDICFHTEKDLVYLSKQEKNAFLKEGEGNA